MAGAEPQQGLPKGTETTEVTTTTSRHICRRGDGEGGREGGRRKKEKKQGETEGERGRWRKILWFCLSSCPLFSFHLLALGPSYEQGDLGDVVYRVQRVLGKCSLQDLLAKEAGETGK